MSASLKQRENGGGAPEDPVLENGNRLRGSGAVSYIAARDGGGALAVLAVSTDAEAPKSGNRLCVSYTHSY